MRNKYIKWLMLMILTFPCIIKAQTASSSHNYVTTETVLKEGVTTDSQVTNLDYTQKSTTINYYDGLGRPDQVVQYKAGAKVNNVVKDIVTPIDYDDYGRESIKYLPYANTSGSGGYVDNDILGQKAYYAPGQIDVKRSLTSVPFSETVFESSPLNRVLEQGAPGKAWQPLNANIANSGHTVKMEYGTNKENDVFRFEVINNQLVKEGYYIASELYKTVSKDENWVSGNLHTTEEFKDKQGQVVLKRSYVEGETAIDTVDTYYVYDDFGLLRYVIPPQAVKNLYKGTDVNSEIELVDQDQTLTGAPQASTYLITKGSSVTLSNFRFSASSGSSLTISAGAGNGDLIYAYKYDGRKRMIEKKIPGAAPVYMVYDNRDRLVSTQDGEMREKGVWLFTKYDILNRPIITGLLSNNLKTQDAMQKKVDDFYKDLTKKYFETRNDSLSTSYSYTTSNSFPEVGIDRWLSITYYDTYGYKDCKAFSTGNNISDEISYNHAVKGQVTGTRTKVLDGNEFSSTQAQWLVSTVYYDNKYRCIQSLTDLFPANGGANYTLVSNNYDFVGKIESSKTINVFQGTTKIIDERYDYDHAGRLLKHYHKINGKNEVLLADNTYNELGQLITKKVGDNVQQMDYQYNIRGWLTQVNDPSVTAAGSKKLALKLDYIDPSSVLNAQKQYNGNISSMIWRTEKQSSVSGDMSAYGFNYDGLNRLTQANYGQGGSSIARNGAYDVTIGNYDLNGNIGILTRKKASTTIDNLSYSYRGNQLLSVNDAANDNVGFKEKSSSGIEYNYDLNGNMTADKNKGLTNVKYNFLNLPELLTGDDNKTIRYIYTADGQKVAKTANGKTTYYTGTTIYEESTLQQVLHSEGTIAMNGSSATYQYHLKDHLGNTRVVVDENNVTNQVSFYYPFGMTAEQFNSGAKNKYLYNGKELQEDAIGGRVLDWYDYGARFYDPAIGRWHSIDLLAEIYFSSTPYHYVLSNPIIFTDAFGLAVRKKKNGYEITGDDAVTYAINMGLVGNGGNTWADFYKSLDDAAAGNKKENKGNKVANRSESTDVYGSGDAKSTKGAPAAINHDNNALSNYRQSIRKQEDLAFQQSVNHAINTDGVNTVLGTLAVPGVIIGASISGWSMGTEFGLQMIKNDFNVQKSIQNFNVTSAIPGGNIYGKAAGVLSSMFIQNASFNDGIQTNNSVGEIVGGGLVGGFTTYSGGQIGKAFGGGSAGNTASGTYSGFLKIMTTYVNSNQ
ncbi:DUF6443 domain-containing protein [Plebeiibacterium sediminum]|uniref:RHS repeat-associated core domain-containing protein n=1 Tax=Plebeiibacterium sediminum TaxID=2992112 RepID=A0AAE3SHG4_9BACT|nr:DUF6443 domain-containing protein [Plebeiobacterium sediminum]MCW3789227.1 RHS repeat-associated core domain-containing protein [Plebeiobacterium sediminum]